MTQSTERTDQPPADDQLATASPNDSRTLDALPFRVDPHMLEDLGLNLYSNLPRVLVEFIANAYDADASRAAILMDFGQISHFRTEMRREVAAAASRREPRPGSRASRFGLAGGGTLAGRGDDLHPGRWSRHVP